MNRLDVGVLSVCVYDWIWLYKGVCMYRLDDSVKIGRGCIE